MHRMPEAASSIEPVGNILNLRPGTLASFAAIVEKFPFPEGTAFGTIGKPERLVAVGYTPKQLAGVLHRLDGELTNGNEAKLFDKPHWQLASMEALKAMSGLLPEAVQEAFTTQIALLQGQVIEQRLGYTSVSFIEQRQTPERLTVKDQSFVDQEIRKSLSEAFLEHARDFARVQKNPKVLLTEAITVAIAACSGGGIIPTTEVPTVPTNPAFTETVPGIPATPTPDQFQPTFTPSGPETTPNSPRPYPSSLTVETATQGILAVEDAPASITGLPEVQAIVTKHTKLARDVGLQFDHMAVKYAPAEERWFLVPVKSDGVTIAGWLQIEDFTSQSGWRFGEQPTWSSDYLPSRDKYQYGLPALQNPDNHFVVGFKNGFPVLIEVSATGAPQRWNNVVEKSMMMVEGAVVPTEIPVPAGLANVPEGYSAVHNADGTWGYGEGVGTEVFPIPGLTVDATGAHFRFEDTVIDIPLSEIKDRIQVGQEGGLQIYDYDKWGFYGIAFAWNPEQNVWVRASDILQIVKSDIPNYITVQTREQLDALFALEKLVLPPFPKDTYFPPLDKIIVDYETAPDTGCDVEFSICNPLGKLPDAELSRSPFHFVNHILLQKGEGRIYDTYIVTEQVYNPADGTFSLLHFGFDAFEPVTQSSNGRGLGTLLGWTDSPKILLPGYYVLPRNLVEGAFCSYYCNELAFFKEHGYFEKNGDMPEMIRLIKLWFSTGKVPHELESLVNLADFFFIGQKK